MKNGKSNIQDMEAKTMYLENLIEVNTEVTSNKNSFLYEDVYKSLIELSFEGIIIGNRQGKILSWNNAIEKLTGIKQSNVIGLNMWEVLYLLTPSEYKDPALLNVLEKRFFSIIDESAYWQRQVNEQKITTANGTIMTVEVSSFITSSQDGNYLVSAFRDTHMQNQSDRELAIKYEALLKLNQLSIELSKLSLEDNMEALITKRLKEVTGAIGVIFSEYNTENRTLTPKHIELESGLLEIIVNLLDNHVHKIHSVISDYMYHELTLKSIEIGNTLTEVTLGAIPYSVGATAQVLLKAERFIRVAFLVEGKLYGIAILAMGKHQSYLPKEVFENFVFLASASLRRNYKEKALRKNEEMLRTITENAGDIILKLDEKGTILYSNRVLFGVKKEDVIGKNYCEWTAPEFHDVMSQSLECVFSEAIPQSYQTRALDINHEIRWYSSRLSPIKVDNEVKNAVLIISDITKQKQEEILLRESEEKFRVIAQSSQDIIFIIDRFGKQLFFNKSVEKVLGYKAEELLGRSFAELLPETSVAGYLSQLANIFLYKEISTFFTQIYHKDGYLVDVEVNVKLVKLKGEYIGQGSIRDITAKKRAEEQLKISTERNNALLEAIPDLMFVFNSNCKIVDFHSESHDQLLVKPEDFLGKLIDDILPHEVVIITHQKVKAVLSTGKSDYSTYELQIGGALKYFESRYVPCGNNEVLSIVRDITEQKHNEEALLLAKESYLDIFNSVSDAIYILDESGTFLDVNKGAEKMYLQTKQELIGKTTELISAQGRNNLDEIQNMISRVNRTGVPACFEFWAKRKNDDVFLKEVIVNRGKYFGKNVLIATSRDITDKKHDEERIKLKNEELQNINAEKDKFFSIISHDLRSPLVSFLGLTQIMAEDLPTLSINEIQDLALGMKNSANNLYGLLENLLEWSRLQRGLTNFTPKPFLLLPKITETMQPILELANKKEIEIGYNIPDDLEVFGDENMISSALRNIASNAVKFTTKGGRINLTAKKLDHSEVEISISDSGIGMNKDLLNKLFSLDKHSTSRTGTDGEPSSGLGLLLCKEFIEKHSGKLWAESEEGKGSTFYFTIPLTDESYGT